MSTIVRYHPRMVDVDLADLPRWLYEEIAGLRGQIGRDDPPVLTCLGNGQPMYIYRNHHGRYFARHFANGNGDNHSHAMSTMSDEHRRESEYTERAAEDHGLAATLEKSTGNGTRVDVAVFGEHNTGFEIQRSSLTRAAARRRTLKSFDAGWPTAWVSDRANDPDWADWVPTARLQTRGIWSEGLPPRNTARVVISNFVRERDGLKWRYRREPHAVLLDDLAWRMPAGEIVPVSAGRQGRVQLAFAAAQEVIDSCTFPGASAWRPHIGATERKEAAQKVSTVCHVGPSPKCRVCGSPMWAPQSRERGFCESCRLRGGLS